MIFNACFALKVTWNQEFSPPKMAYEIPMFVFLPKSFIYTHSKRFFSLLLFLSHWFQAHKPSYIVQFVSNAFQGRCMGTALHSTVVFLFPCALASIWEFPKIVVPQNGWFIMVPNPIKMDDLGKTHFFGNTHLCAGKKTTVKSIIFKWKFPRKKSATVTGLYVFYRINPTPSI